MHSSTSIDMRFRNSIVVGFIRFSPSEIVGNSSGSPPASSTPRFTASASERKWRLQFPSSDHELQIPITGRPASALREIPSAWIDERWMKPARSAPPNQRRLRMHHLALGEERAEALDRRRHALLERRVREGGQQLRERRAVDLGGERQPHVVV